MNLDEQFARIRTLSDGDLLASLGNVLGTSRNLAALLVAHLGEVEERRLHLLTGYGSMFAYCTTRLGMSEDEACRRIEVARLARRFPTVLERLAGGLVSMSVVALLKERLSDANHVALLAAVAGKTVAQAREVLASWFPQPDVPATIRKLPERTRGAPGKSAHEHNARNPIRLEDANRAQSPESLVNTEPLSDSAGDSCTERTSTDRSSTQPATAPAHTSAPPATVQHSSAEPAPLARAMIQHADTERTMAERAGAARATAEAPAIERTRLQPTSAARTMAGSTTAEPASLQPTNPERALAEHATPAVRTAALSMVTGAGRVCSTIQPLSPGRYRVQFTADAALKEKLDLARDLLRHTLPHGDLPSIIDRAIDLLLQETMRRRFAKTTKTRAPTPASASPASASAATSTAQATSAAQKSPAQSPSTQTTPPPVSFHSIAPRQTSAPSAAAAAAAAAQTPSSRVTSTQTTSPPVSFASTAHRQTSARSATATTATAQTNSSPITSAQTTRAPDPSVPSAPPQTSFAPFAPPQRLDARTATEATPPAPSPSARAAAPAPRASRHIPSAVRRAVLERDGLRCTWCGPDGVRCESRAWLEHDHVVPRGLGGRDDAENGRIFCRAHNRFAAEQVYGQPFITRVITRQRAKRRATADADLRQNGRA